jgi:SpoIID/LytB domain protein
MSPLVEEAIQATRGIVLTDIDGRICDARFSKCCGGRTELFSTCWQDVDFDYLRAVDDPYCSPDFIETLPGGMNSVLLQVLNNYDQQTVDFHDWQVEYTQEELSSLVEKKLSLQLGTIQHLMPVERGASGRIKMLKIVGSEKTVVIGKELLIRKAFSKSHLYSSWFDVEESLSPEDGSLHFLFKGHGWGHGVGLCQIGAAAMALKGFTAEEILSYYYPGANFTTLY